MRLSAPENHRLSHHHAQSPIADRFSASKPDGDQRVDRRDIEPRARLFGSLARRHAEAKELREIAAKSTARQGVGDRIAAGCALPDAFGDRGSDEMPRRGVSEMHSCLANCGNALRGPAQNHRGVSAGSIEGAGVGAGYCGSRSEAAIGALRRGEWEERGVDSDVVVRVVDFGVYSPCGTCGEGGREEQRVRVLQCAQQEIVPCVCEAVRGKRNSVPCR